MDLVYAVSSLSRFSSMPRKGHMELAKRLMGYVKKYPKRGYAINPMPLNLNIKFNSNHLIYKMTDSIAYLDVWCRIYGAEKGSQGGSDASISSKINGVK
eukprot:11377452-Ditylum_brightwellii.AAC.1